MPQNKSQECNLLPGKMQLIVREKSDIQKTLVEILSSAPLLLIRKQNSSFSSLLLTICWEKEGEKKKKT